MIKKTGFSLEVKRRILSQLLPIVTEWAKSHSGTVHASNDEINIRIPRNRLSTIQIYISRDDLEIINLQINGIESKRARIPVNENLELSNEMICDTLNVIV